ALDSDNQPHLAWRSSQVDIFYCRSSDGGGTFSTVVNASNTGFSVSPSQPTLAVDAQKNIYVAWTNSDSDLEQQDIYMASSTDGAQFQPLSNISLTMWDASFADWPKLVVDAAGNLTATWRQIVANPTKMNDPERDMFYS